MNQFDEAKIHQLQTYIVKLKKKQQQKKCRYVLIKGKKVESVMYVSIQ